MKGWRKAAAAAALVGAGFAGGVAQAADYAVTYTSVPIEGIGPSAFAGTLTTSDTADANGYYTVTGITGVRNGLKVSLVPAGSYFDNGNRFQPIGSYVDESGIVFSDGVTNYAVYRYDGYYYEYLDGAGFNYIDTFTAVALPGAAAVPEPAAWAMMMLGVGAIGFAMRRRKVATRVSYAA